MEDLDLLGIEFGLTLPGTKLTNHFNLPSIFILRTSIEGYILQFSP